MAKTKINSLTPKQAEALPLFRSEWFRSGTSTARAERAKAESAILKMRIEIGVTKKPIFLWGRSPRECLLILWLIKSKAWAENAPKLGGQLGGQIGGQLGGQIGGQLGGQLGDQLRGQLGDQLRGQLGVQLRGQLWDQLRGQLGDQLRGQLGDQLRGQLWEEINNAWWGQHEAYWVAYYLFCREVVGAKYDEISGRRLNMWRDLAESCCWWWCYENYVVASERPTVCRMTEAEGKLHSEEGPALAFADGLELWRWHGEAIPPEAITAPGSLRAEQLEGLTEKALEFCLPLAPKAEQTLFGIRQAQTRAA